MALTTQRHANIVANVLATLHGQLRGTRCRPTASGIGVQTRITTIRYPDLIVDCGPREDQAMCATSTVLVCEVLSPSRDPFDTDQRVSEYRTSQDIVCVLLIDPDAPRAILHRRDDAGWHDSVYNGLDQIVEFPGIGAAVPLCDIFDGLEFSHRVDGIRGSRC